MIFFNSGRRFHGGDSRSFVGLRRESDFAGFWNFGFLGFVKGRNQRRAEIIRRGIGVE